MAKEQDFIKGWPEPCLLEGTALRSALVESFQKGIEMSAQSLNYGDTSGAYMLGHPRFLSALSKFLEGQYGVPVSDKDLMSTAGSSMGMDIVTRMNCKAGDICIVEEPTYFLAFTMCRDQGMELLGVPLESDGIDINAVEKACKENPGKIKMVYTVPINHNPAGYTMSDAKRAKLVALAKEHNFIIVADEAYQLLNFEKTSTKPLFYHDDPADPRVFCLGTLSKLIGPGVKVGWIQAHNAILKKLTNVGFVDSGNNPVIFSSCNLIHFLESGNLAKHIDMVSAVLGKRCKLLCDKLREVGLEVVDPKGGYFVWVNMAGRSKVTGRKGDAMSVKKDQFHDWRRLCFAWLPEEKIIEGIEYIRENPKL
jgi:DNA-binding transcriptional MocR family regulator